MTLRYALILDTETTGLSVAEGARCIEVACIVYDLECAAPIASYASLMRSETNEAEAINRIPVSALRKAPLPDGVWDRVSNMADRCDVIIAHRSEFDRQFVPMSIQEHKWLCSKFHVDWPRGKPGDSLVPLALAHGIGVVHAHRAMTDCDIISRLLTRVHEMGTPLVPLLERAMRPRVKVRGCQAFEQNDLAKQHGFAFDWDRKIWTAELPVDVIETLPFRTEPL